MAREVDERRYKSFREEKEETLEKDKRLVPQIEITNEILLMENYMADAFFRERLEVNELDYASLKETDIDTLIMGNVPVDYISLSNKSERSYIRSPTLSQLAMESIFWNLFINCLSYDDKELISCLINKRATNELISLGSDLNEPIVAIFDTNGMCVYLAREESYNKNIRLPKLSKVLLLLQNCGENFVRFYRFTDSEEDILTDDELDYLNEVRKFLRKCDINLDSIIDIGKNKLYIRYQFNREIEASKKDIEPFNFDLSSIENLDNLAFYNAKQINYPTLSMEEVKNLVLKFYRYTNQIPLTPYINKNDIKVIQELGKTNEITDYFYFYLASKIPIEKLSIYKEYYAYKEKSRAIVKNPIDLLRVVRKELHDYSAFIISLDENSRLINIDPWRINKQIDEPKKSKTNPEDSVLKALMSNITDLISRKGSSHIYIEIVENPFSDVVTKDKVLTLVRGLAHYFDLLGLHIIDVIMIKKDFVSPNTDWIYSSCVNRDDISENDKNFNFVSYYENLVNRN